MVAPLTTLKLRIQPISISAFPSSMWLSTMRGCQPGRPLKLRILAHTFSMGASITLEMVTLGMFVPQQFMARADVGGVAGPRLSKRIVRLSFDLNIRRQTGRLPGRVPGERPHGHGKSV